MHRRFAKYPVKNKRGRPAQRYLPRHVACSPTKHRLYGLMMRDSSPSLFAFYKWTSCSASTGHCHRMSASTWRLPRSVSFRVTFDRPASARRIASTPQRLGCANKCFSPQARNIADVLLQRRSQTKVGFYIVYKCFSAQRH